MQAQGRSPLQQPALAVESRAPCPSEVRPGVARWNGYPTIASSAPTSPYPPFGHGPKRIRVLLQAGAAAGAVASIVGLMLTFGTFWRADGSDGASAADARVTLTKPDVQVMDYQHYVLEHREKLTGVPSRDLTRNGIGVDYRVTIGNAPPQTAYPVRLTLQRSVGDVTVPVTPQDNDALNTGVDPQTAQTVGKAFLTVDRPGRYRVRIDIMSPSDHDNPIESARSRTSSTSAATAPQPTPGNTPLANRPQPIRSPRRGRDHETGSVIAQQRPHVHTRARGPPGAGATLCGPARRPRSSRPHRGGGGTP